MGVTFLKKVKVRKKKTSRKKLIKQLDVLVSLIIRSRDKRCVICGKQTQLSNGHIFSRTSYSTRWDISEDGNCHCQCWGCNLRHEYDSFPYAKWYIDKFGLEKYTELHIRYKSVKKFKDFELAEMVEEFKQILEDKSYE